MSNGGYKGASPARETSPEQYPGVWELTEQFQAQADGNWPFQAADCAPKSLRFNSYSPSGYLTRTPTAASNQRTWTWSGWVKRSIADGNWRALFTAINPDNSNRNDGIWFSGPSTGDQIYVSYGNNTDIQFSPRHRDSSAWFNICVSLDTTRATDQVQCFVNGEKLSIASGSQPAQNYQGGINTAVSHSISRRDSSNSQFFDGLLSEVTFIDGQALSCEEFGFFDGQGIWQPKRFTGDYATGTVWSNYLTATNGGFHAAPYNEPAGFNGFVGSSSGGYVQTANGTANPNSLTFTPPTGIPYKDKVEVWLINSANTVSVNGGTAQSIAGTQWVQVATGPGTLTSIKFERPSTNGASFGGIRIDGMDLTDPPVGRNSFHLDFSDGVKDQSGLSNDWTGNNVSIFSGSAVSRIWETTSTYTPSGGSPTNHWAIASGGGSATKAIDGNYGDLFSEVLEPGKIYAFTTAWPNGDDNGGWWFGDSNANGLSGTHPNQGRGSNSLGQRGRSANPANDTAGAYGTFLAPNGLSSASDSNLSGFQNINPYGTTSIDWVVDRTTNKVWAKPSSNSTWVKGGNPSDGSSTPTFHLPATGNLYFGFNQHSSMSSPGATITSFSFNPTDRANDILVDSPVNGNEASTGAGGERRGNYCCLNPLDALATSLRNGNLTAIGNTSTAGVTGSISVSSGKWYFEMTAGSDKDIAGIWPTSKPISGFPGSTADSYGYFGSGVSLWSGSGYTYGSSFSAGDIIGVALDLDNGSLVFYKNNVSQGTAFTGLVGGFRPSFRAGRDDTASTATVNFGQHSFSYAPPAGFSPLATSFLPEPSGLAKNPSKAFDILLWSGDGANSDRTISGIDMESGPDMVWSKTRNHGYHNNIFDSVRGFGNSGGPPLTTDYKDSQASGGVIKSTDSTSITWEKATNNAYVWYGESGKNYVSWLWDAGTATTTIAAGGSNNLAYDQSQTWSNSLSASFRGSEPATNAFDGDTSTIAGSAGSITYTSPVAVASSSTIRVIVHGGDHNVSVNSGANQTVAAGSFVTLNFTNPTNNTFTITFDRVSNGADTGVRAIEIGGKLLVDNGVSVTNVPEVECKVRANPEAGFSIVKVDSPNSTETRVHGLSKAPDFIIAKATASGNTQHYHMFHSYFGKSHYATFTGDAWTSSDQWGSQEPNSHSFYVKTNTGSGANFSGGMIYYIWHAVENYSAMGSYVGTGVNPGPMIHLGWEPKWLMIKSTDTSRHWRIYDATREPSNVKTLSLHASTANTETHFGSDEMDFLSNGFKIRSTGSFHNSQDKVYLYVAFAANPFLHARAH